LKISIITATYNSESTLAATLASLDEQTYSDVEHIIIDGGSSDETKNIALQHGAKIAKFVSEPDAGIYSALNKGISHATGNYIGFLHSDDEFSYPDAVSDMVRKINETQADAVYGDLVYVSRKNTKMILRYWKSGEFSRRKLMRGWMPPHPTFYMKRELYEQFGGFDLQFDISADYELLLRYLWKHKISISYLPKILVEMKVGGKSNSSLENIYKKTKEDILSMKANQLPVPMAIAMKNLSKIPQLYRR